MGVKMSKRYFSYKLHPKLLKLVLNFPPTGSRKTTFEIACISKTACPRAKLREIWASGEYSAYTGYF